MLCESREERGEAELGEDGGGMEQREEEGGGEAQVTREEETGVKSGVDMPRAEATS